MALFKTVPCVVFDLPHQGGAACGRGLSNQIYADPLIKHMV